MKKIKKSLLFAVVTVVLMLGFAFGASAVTGQCGQNVFYYYDSSTGEFIIRGEGAVDEWQDVHNVEDWRNIKTVIVENGVTSLGKSNPAFSGCQNLKNVVLPEGVIAIPKAYFCDCPALDGVVIPESCTSIGMEAFAECTKLKNIVIPKNVPIIGLHAFWGCTNLKSVTIQSNTLSIGSFAFENCTNLSDVYFSGTEEEWNEIEIGECNDELLNATIHFNHKHIDLTSDGFCDDCTAKVGAAHTHTYSSAVTKSATCTANGIKTFTCSCGDTYTEIIKATGAHKGGTATCTTKAICTVCKQSYGSLKSHTYANTPTKATLSKDGKVESKCTACGNVNSSTVINKVKSVKLSATAIAYNGKNQTPSVTVKDSKGKTLKKGTDYTVTYPKKRKSIGKYTVTVTFKGNYSGTKKLTFEIVPAKANLSKLTAGKKQLTATWKTVSGVTGYEVQYSTSKKFTKKTTKTVTIKKAKTKKTTIKKLSKGKKYFVRVRAYETVSGKKIYGAYSAVKNVKVK